MQWGVVFLAGTLTGKAGTVSKAPGGLCLETRQDPEAIQHPDGPSGRLIPGQTSRRTMVHRFTP